MVSTSGHPGSRQVNALTETVTSSTSQKLLRLQLQLLNGLGVTGLLDPPPIGKAIFSKLLASERICEGWRPQHRNGQAPMPLQLDESALPSIRLGSVTWALTLLKACLQDVLGQVAPDE